MDSSFKTGWIDYVLLNKGDVMPTASADVRGMICVFRGSPDLFYLCRIAADGATYEWVNLVANNDLMTAAFIVAPPVFQDSSTTASTSATVTYQDAASMSFVLPAGTWTVTTDVSLQLIHSTGGGTNVRAMIDGTAGTNNTEAVDSVIYQPSWAGQQKTSVAGGRTIVIKVQYKCNSGGTTTARQPRITANAQRTA